MLFQSQARFFGALSVRKRDGHIGKGQVSIAGAILWGFERRSTAGRRKRLAVSIAGAILWGFEPPSPT